MNKFLSKNSSLTIIGTLVLSLFLAAASNAFSSTAGWLSFFILIGLTAGLVWGGFWLLRYEPIPSWLKRLTIGAALLRLAAGVFWVVALPSLGYSSEVQQAGYIMEDAYQRDQVAWELSQSDHPLIAAFIGTEHRSFQGADQYGGLLFLSASIYRFLGGVVHQPLLIVVITAGVSALAVVFGWAFATRTFGSQTALWTAWGLALYPEAVLLGSSQMREAFFIPLVTVAFYLLSRYAEDRAWKRLGWLGLILAAGLPVSPPLTGILLGLIGITGLAMDNWQILRNWRLWAVLLGGMLVALAGAWITWGQVAPRLGMVEYANPLALLIDWVTFAARWQAKLTIGGSGWVQKIIKTTPEWVNLPFLVGYGIVRPLLPAALLDAGNSFWQGVAIWRALGWTVLLPFVVYAPLRAIRAADDKAITLGLSLVVWLTILIAAFWGGADQWDNPRYRAVFSSIQIMLAAWVITTQQSAPDPWMRRVLISVIILLSWFIPWYLRRYTPVDWPVKDVFKSIGLGLASAALYIIWDWASPSQIHTTNRQSQ